MNSLGAPHGIISVKIKDTATLFSTYMPFLKNGGLFTPTAQSYALGDEVVLLISLLDEGERLSVAGKVAWITPIGAQGNRMAGIGVHFNESSDGEVARSRIESILAAMLSSERATQTM